MLAGSFLADASTGQPSGVYEYPARLAFRSWRARIVRRGWLNGVRSVAPFRLLDAFTRHAGKDLAAARLASANGSLPFASPDRRSRTKQPTSASLASFSLRARRKRRPVVQPGSARCRWWGPDSPVCAGFIRCRIRFTDCADRSRSFRRTQI